MSLFTKFLKVFLTLFYVIFLIPGFFVIKYSYLAKSLDEFVKNEFHTLFFGLWVVAILIVITSLIGIFSIWTENSRMILVSAVLIFICLVSNVAFFYTNQKVLDDIKLEMIRNQFIGQYRSQPAEIKRSIQITQQNNHCCGVDSYKDYNLKVSEIPSSCCGHFNLTSGEEERTCTLIELVNVEGCGNLLKILLSDSTKSGLILFISFSPYLAFHLIGIIFLWVLNKKIGQKNSSKIQMA